MKKGMVFGAGVSGLGAKDILIKMGYEVILVDDKIAMTSKEALEKLKEIDIFIKSPGVPYTELVKKVKEMNIEIIDEIELGYRYKIQKQIPGKIIAITGTNGKTTVTTKITELLNFSGFKAKFCGNIGVSFSKILIENEKTDYFVLELSSYQLENIKEFKADIAMIINLAPDHLNRYKDEEHYYDTKFNIINNQTKEDLFILNVNCDNLMKRAPKIKSKISLIGLDKKMENQQGYIKDGFLIYENENILDISRVSLKGKHNLENMLFIVSTVKYLGVSNNKIREFLYNTTSLEHRMEIFYNYGLNKFVNDSKGTNIESTKFAIEAYNSPILICGGVDKKLDLKPLAKIIKEKVKEVYLIGEIADKLENELKEINYDNSKIFNLKELENVVIKLKENLKEDAENIVLFSPTTASFDQFKNFEMRGKIFKELIFKYFK